MENDASLIEINPLVRTGAGDFVALDGKMGFDDSALGRHPDIEAMRDVSEEIQLKWKLQNMVLAMLN